MPKRRLLETEWEELDLRYYEAGEVSSLLQAAGFTSIQYYQAYGRGVPDDNDESLVFECVRS
jgi:hypothetical protein